MKAPVKVYCRPDNKEQSEEFIKFLNESSMGEYFEFTLVYTYLVDNDRVEFDLPPVVIEFLKKQYSSKRPLGIPLIVK